ncbi:uncharacterized protein J8A68_006013 [[Candida] subhashii]|uniref:Vps72/YL1 C-terminal domain-containing protein n=1 Tax=[Candida] subhashii TaxID=561895 RepID=A0A8J5QL29_9ASCO|nr:uncharacterized protein J8A68_006013 [[Candida] subhashii]KAG7660475.1 hypothetical protein J8A68_006013 [[Candida] subhashii]
MDSDSLVATRARRPNAGSRLKQLIELEEQGNEQQQQLQFIDDDDENVNLLFQEDGEDDEEFIDEDIDNANLIGIDESEEEEEEEDEEEDGSRKRVHEDNEDEEDEGMMINSDENLSDSEISASDSDESEGEKELQRQEKKKRRKLKQSLIPAIKKAKPSPSITITTKDKTKLKRRSALITSQSLLMSERRSSSRSAAVENKQALIEKLKESEERRAHFTPIVRKKHVELTQEQRLAEAVETERLNIEALNRFREQEVVKKERQRQLLLAKRVKLHNVIRFVSKETFISPIEEVLEARKDFEKSLKGKRKFGRKKKDVEDGGQEDPKIRIPFDINYDLPFQKEELEKQRKIQEEEEKLRQIEEERIRQEEERQKAEESLKVEQENENEVETIDGENAPRSQEESNEESANESKDSAEGEQETSINGDADSIDKQTPLEKSDDIHEDNKSDDILVDNDISKDMQIEEDEGETALTNKEQTEETLAALEKDEEPDVSENAQQENKIEGDSILENNDSSKRVEMEDIQHTAEVQSGSNMDVDQEIETKDDQQESQDQSIDSLKPDEEPPLDPIKVENDETETATSVKVEEVPNEIKEEKHVKFADEIDDSMSIEPTPISPETTPTPILKIDQQQQEEEDQKSKEIFEGPPQKVWKNTIYLLDFDEDRREFRLNNSTNLKRLLFGKQSLLPAMRRFKDGKTILHIGKTENPYARAQQQSPPEDDVLFEPVTNISESSAIFDELKRLPKLGVKQDTIQEISDTEQQESHEIVLKTQPPSGLYLPNNNRKPCMISGTEVKYFDPTTGIPYSSVQAYRLVKLIEGGKIPWISMSHDEVGEIELYAGNREGVRHAKGVPEGFE